MKAEANLRLRAARNLRGLRQVDLAQKIGRSQAWLCDVEQGHREPSEIDIALICRALRVKPQAVFPPSEPGSDPLAEIEEVSNG